MYQRRYDDSEKRVTVVRANGFRSFDDSCERSRDIVSLESLLVRNESVSEVYDT